MIDVCEQYAAEFDILFNGNKRKLLFFKGRHASAITSVIISVYEKLQDTRTKVAPVNLIYGSHFSATEATYKVSQNMRNFVEFTRTFTRITHKQVPV